MAIGTGILLLEADLLRRVSPPWFSFVHDDKHDEYVGEDFFLCTRLREAGASIHANLSFSYQVGHVGAHRYKFDPSTPMLAP